MRWVRKMRTEYEPGERSRTAIVLSIPVLVVLVTAAVAFMDRMQLIPVYVGLVGVLVGLVLAVYDGIEDRASGGDQWGWALLAYPVMLFIPLALVGLLILAVYNLFAHGTFAVNL